MRSAMRDPFAAMFAAPLWEDAPTWEGLRQWTALPQHHWQRHSTGLSADAERVDDPAKPAPACRAADVLSAASYPGGFANLQPRCALRSAHSSATAYRNQVMPTSPRASFA